VKSAQIHIILILSIVILSVPLMGQQPQDEAVAFRIITPIDVDGQLIEAAWQQAPEASAYLQSHPLRDDPSKVQTVVKILYDNDYLYLGFDCFDSEAEKIIADIRTRDGELRTDDSVHVLLDSIHDPDNFYYFSTNPWGTLSDGKFSLADQIYDPAWQGEWRAAAQRTDSGWTVEIGIALSSLGYRTASRKTIGLGLSRIVPRLDSAFWSGPLDPAFDLDATGIIRELELLEAISKLKITPYAMSGNISNRKAEFSAGLDLNYAFSPAMTGNVSVYPEFDTVRADQELINLTLFELRLDELRDYFLDGIDGYFQQPLEAFYSKRVDDIYGGVKLYGESGPLEFSGTSFQARKLESDGDKSANWSSVRLKNEFGKLFELGVTAANKSLAGTNFGSASADGMIKIGDRLRLFGLFSYSYGDFNSNNTAYLIKGSYVTQTFHTQLSYSQIEDRFWDNANAVGYIQDDNRKELDFKLGKAFQFSLGSVSGLEYDSAYNVYWGMDEVLRSWQIDQEVALRFGGYWKVGVHFRFDYKLNEIYPEWMPEDGLVLAQEWEDYRQATIDSLSRWNPQFVFDMLNPALVGSSGGYSLYLGSPEYKNSLIEMVSGYDSDDNNAFWLSYGFGNQYAKPINTFKLYKEFSFTQSFYLQYEFSHLNYRGEISGVDLPVYRDNAIHVFKLNYTASPKVYLGGFIQTSSLRKKHSLHLEAKYFFLPPYGYAQIVYKHGLSPFNGLKNQDSAIYLKVLYEF